MPSNLAGAVNIGQFDACIFRAAKLDSDCSILGGNSSGAVTAGLIQMTATPEVEQGTTYEPKNGCGRFRYSVRKASRIKSWNLEGEMIFFDFELLEVLFGGTLILGAAGGDYAGEVIGWGPPGADADEPNGVYLEVITNSAAEGAGDCVVVGSDRPSYFGHVFTKVRLTPGARTFAEDFGRMAFTGVATTNPNGFNGPWNDYPGAGYMPSLPYFQVGYSQTEYDTIEAMVAAGYADLPAGS
jgi:hypothetical protein